MFYLVLLTKDEFSFIIDLDKLLMDNHKSTEFFLEMLRKQIDEQIENIFFGFSRRSGKSMAQKRHELIEKIMKSRNSFITSINIVPQVIHLDRNQITILNCDSNLSFENSRFISIKYFNGMEIRETDWPGPHFS